MIILNSPQVMQETALRWKKEQEISLVPTMGALHEGHLALVDHAKSFGGRCIVTIFVNPLQFGPKEDFEKYPRTMEDDIEKLEDLEVDCLFAPTVRDFYPEGFQTNLTVGPLANHLCGKSRPGHFAGVVTVCLKLFQSTLADVALFGEKDFQQLTIIRKMTEDFNLPLRIAPHPIVREADGLALSSRNRNLSVADRKSAAAIPKALEWAQSHLNEKVGTITDAVSTRLTAAGLRVDYVAICSELDLVPQASEVPISEVRFPRIIIAAFAGATRLIDNMTLSAPGQN